MLFLTEPAPQYKKSFLEGIHEFQREGLLLEYDIQRIDRDFATFLNNVQFRKDRTKLPPHLVPSTDYWLILGDEESGTFIGRLSLRHELNAFLLKIGGHIGYQIRPSLRRRGYGTEQLRLGLQKAREHGLIRVLVTCDENNIGSKKIIEYNGGQLENAIDIEGSPVKKLRYWIDLP